VTLAVTGILFPVGFFDIRECRCLRGIERLLTEIDEIIRWLVTVERRLTLCVFPVFGVAVMEKCCDACGEGEYYFRSKVFDDSG
jgi:hypothetical protein